MTKIRTLVRNWVISLLAVLVAVPQVSGVGLAVAVGGPETDRLLVRTTGEDGWRTDPLGSVAYLKWSPVLGRVVLLDRNAQMGAISVEGVWRPLPRITAALGKPGVSDLDVDRAVRVAVFRDDPEGETFLVQPLGGKRRTVLSREKLRRLGGYAPGERRQFYDFGLRLSPDAHTVAVSVPSKRIVFPASGDHGSDTYVVGAAGGSPRRIGPGVPLGWLDARRVVLHEIGRNRATVRDARNGRALRSFACRTAFVGEGVLATVRPENSRPVVLDVYKGKDLARFMTVRLPADVSPMQVIGGTVWVR